jgi:hypothetical protein
MKNVLHLIGDEDAVGRLFLAEQWLANLPFTDWEGVMIVSTEPGTSSSTTEKSVSWRAERSVVE